MQHAVAPPEEIREEALGLPVDLREDHLVLGRYRPLRPLGSGGHGSVWLARDERSSRDVALKVVPREGKAGSRAEREVEAATRLRHPRCVKVLGFDRDERHVYVAYEHVAGQTLRAALRAGELDDAAAIEAAAQVLEALAHAHGKRIVHRDVKPANVMLEDGDGVSALLLDFGLAQLEEADSLTAVGDVPGTLAYIAPERLDGEEATGASDVWSVGVILWEALAGWHPFFTASPLETARRIAAGAQPLSRARPDLPRALCETVDRMLAPDPGRRPQAKRLAHDLREAAEARTRRPRSTVSAAALRERAPHAALAALFAGGSASLLPFYPRGWPLLLAALAAFVAVRSPRAGLAAALAVPVLPLGNISLGLALAYVPLAAGWALLFARDARSGLLLTAGPLLGPIGALALVPLLAVRAGGAARRAAVAAGASLAAMGTAALAGAALPFTGGRPPLGLGITASESPSAVVWALVRFLGENRGLLLATAVLAVAAVALPRALGRGLWGAALWGAGLLATILLLPPLAGGGHIDAFPLVLFVWVAAAALAVQAERRRR
jgi:hypothetical protein